MERAYLGETGVRVSRIVVGCGNFGGVGSAPAFFGRGETREEAFTVMDAAWEAGITTFDTADAYGGGRSESWIGDWLRTKGPEVHERIVLSTKTFNPMGEGEDHGLAPARVRRQLESSLGRLGVEHVDMYLAHAWDPDVPVAETLGVLGELVAAGKVRAVGASNVDGAQLREALAASSTRGLVRFGWVQNSYSLLDREPEREVLPLCAEHALGFTPFSPLGGGWLTGKYRRGESAPPGSRMTTRPEPYLHRLDDDSVWRGLDGLAAAARERGTTPAALALAWLLADPRVTAVILGPRRPEHIEPALAALAAPLSERERAELAGLFA
ncbi:MAG TPA: aldo/keto reductase [Gaiellaceae bacterium]|nr:aldo/keto reductase [Gaiellaceae bacterium]